MRIIVLAEKSNMWNVSSAIIVPIGVTTNYYLIAKSLEEHLSS